MEGENQESIIMSSPSLIVVRDDSSMHESSPGPRAGGPARPGGDPSLRRRNLTTLPLMKKRSSPGVGVRICESRVSTRRRSPNSASSAMRSGAPVGAPRRRNSALGKGGVRSGDVLAPSRRVHVVVFRRQRTVGERTSDHSAPWRARSNRISGGTEGRPRRHWLLGDVSMLVG